MPGAPFDLGVVPVDVLKDAAAQARFGSGPTIDIARVGYGVVIRAGAPKPDVSSPNSLKQTLLKAQSITFLPESAAGAYVLSVFARLGIAEAMKNARPSRRPLPRARPDSGCFFIEVLMAPGVELAGPFPGDLQQELVFTAAVAADTEGSGRRQGVHHLSDGFPPAVR